MYGVLQMEQQTTQKQYLIAVMALAMGGLGIVPSLPIYGVC